MVEEVAAKMSKSSSGQQPVSKVLSEEARPLFREIPSSSATGTNNPKDEISSRFLARHEIADKSLSVRWPVKRSSTEWSAVQPVSSHTEWGNEGPHSLGEMGLAHMKRELCKLQRRYKEPKGIEGRFEVIGTENILSKDSIGRFRAVELESKFLPGWGFHSTNANSVDSIARYGLLAAGDLHPSTGDEISRSHGSVYGNGCYLSPSLDFSVAYAGVEDENHILQTVLCLVSFGTVRHLCHPCTQCEKDFNSRDEFRAHCLRECPYRLEKQRFKSVIASAPYNKFDSLVSPDQLQWIIRNDANARVLPVLIVRFIWRREGWSPARFFAWSQISATGEEQTKRIETAEGFFPVAIVRNAENEKVEKMYWTLTFRASVFTETLPLVYLSVICERSIINYRRGKDILRTLGNFQRSFSLESCNIIAFGADEAGAVRFRRNVDDSFLDSARSFDLFETTESSQQTGVTNSLFSACLKAVELNVSGSAERYEHNILDLVENAETEMFTPILPPFSDQQSTENICRRISYACLDKAIEITSGLREKVERRLLEARANIRPRETFIYLILIDSALDENDQPSEAASFELHRAQKYIEGSCMASKCAVLKVGPIQEKPVHALAASSALSSIVHFTSKVIHMASTDPDSIQSCLQEIREEFCTDFRSWVLAVPETTTLGDGFVISPDLPPVRTVNIGDLSDDGESSTGLRTIIFQTQGETPPPRWVLFGGWHQVQTQVFLHQVPINRLLGAMRLLGLSARIMAARGRSTQEFLFLGQVVAEEANMLLEKINPPKKVDSSSMLMWMASRKTLLTNLMLLRELLNEVRSASQLFSSNRIAFCEWLVKPLDWKFGKRALKRSLVPLGVDTIDEKDLLLQARTEFNLNDTFVSYNLMELLYTVSFGNEHVRAVRCKVAKTDGVVVDPFLAKVEFLSGEFAESTCEVVCELDAGVIRKDSQWASRVPDGILVSINDSEEAASRFNQLRRTILFRAFHAVILARNPVLQLPDQQLALLFASFTRGCEQLMRWRDLKQQPQPSQNSRPTPSFTFENVKGFIETTRSVFLTLRNQCQDSTRNKRILHIISGLEQDERLLPAWLPKTETTGVSSVCEALGVACANPRIHETLGIKKMIPVALIAEAVARQVRVTIRKRPDFSRLLLRKALGITMDSCPELVEGSGPDAISDDVDILSGFSFTVEYFSRPCPTNCSVWGVVASLGLCELFHLNSSNEEVFRALTLTPQVSMKAFLDRFLPEVPPRLLQVALFAQAVVATNNVERASRANALVEGLRNPKSLLKSLASAERLALYADRLAKLRAEARLGLLKENARVRQILKLNEQKLFLAVHMRAPKVFLPGEIEILNRERSDSDKLELDTSSGLLRHHCCQEACPQYLVNLRTERDKWTNKRNGLFRHLKLFLYPQRQYLNSLHTLSKSFIVDRQHSHIRCTRDEYRAYIKQYHDRQPRSKQYVAWNYLDKLMDEIYEKWVVMVEHGSREN